MVRLGVWGAALSLSWGLAAPLSAALAGEADPALPVAAAVPSESVAAQEFDLPAQPLGEALKRYAGVTRRAALARSELVAGRTSTAVRGAYTPDAALLLLLTGTGLEAQQIPGDSAGGFVLRPINPPTPSGARRAGLGDLSGYPSLLQARVWLALCGDSQTAPGTYRSLLRLQVDAAGRVQHVRLIGSTGLPARDAAILHVLQRVRLDRPPPSGLPQPITLYIEPGEEDGRSDCVARGVPR